MLNWIRGYVDRWAGVVDSTVRDLVHWGLHALAGVVYAVFGNVGKAWGELHLALQWMHQEADAFSGQLTQLFTGLVRVDLPRLWSYAVGAFQAAESLALRYYRLATAAIGALQQLAAQWIRDAERWVLVTVYAPLRALADQLRTDLVKWGLYAYDLLTHPDRLAGILLTPLVTAAEAGFWQLAAPVGTFALRLLVANLRRLLPLVEAIVTAVL